jgi:hypothetical protein
MNIVARCGWCGSSFTVAELIAPGADGRCPRCGVELAPSYAPLLDAALRELAAAADALAGALWQVREVAPRLDIDVRQLGSDLEIGRR